jgi:hypothetical protein
MPRSRLQTRPYCNRLIGAAATLAVAAGFSGLSWPLMVSGHAQTNGEITQALVQMKRVNARAQQDGHYLSTSAIVEDLERHGVAAMAANNLELQSLGAYDSGASSPLPGLVVSGDRDHLRLDRFLSWDVHLEGRPGQAPETWSPTIDAGSDYVITVEVIAGLAGFICLILLIWAEAGFRRTRRSLLAAA